MTKFYDGTIFWSSNGSSWTTTFRVTYIPPRDPPLDPRFVDYVYEACAVLELEPPLRDKQEVERARRRLAKRHHPDAGGSLALMQRVNQAADELISLWR